MVPRGGPADGAARRAEILFYPTAIGWHPEEKDRVGRRPARRLGDHPAFPRHRQRLFCRGGQSRGLRTGPGTGEGIEFWGQSFIVGPDGQIMARAPATGEAIVLVELDLDDIARPVKAGRFCATGASMRTLISIGAILMTDRRPS